MYKLKEAIEKGEVEVVEEQPPQEGSLIPVEGSDTAQPSKSATITPDGTLQMAAGNEVVIQMAL